MTEEQQLEKIARIHITLWAYAYEVMSIPMVSDAEYDELARTINPQIETDHPELDKFFKDHYTPDSGMWIHKHPDLGRIKATFNSIRSAL